MLQLPSPRYSMFVFGIMLFYLAGTYSVPAYSMDEIGKISKPNVVVILSDDQGWGDCSVNGNPYVLTSVLDKLSHEGARFDRFFVSPLCAPTRASFLTGRYHLRTGTASVTGGLETMRNEEVTIAEAFKGAGYTTGIFGKWHNGAHYPEHPLSQGFDEFFGFCGGHWTNYFNTSLEHDGKMVATTGYITNVLTDAALNFIQKNQSNPFFCYIPFNAPHAPFQVPDRYFDRYKTQGLNDEVSAVYGMVSNLDENVGRILDKLKELKLDDNTIVVFFTDNGPNSERYNGDMKGRKGSVDEGGSRVPLFIRWPGKIKENVVVKPLAAHIDLYPTLIELTGIPMPKTLPQDGKSLVPLLYGPAPAWPERTFFTHVYKKNALSGDLSPYPGAIRTTQYRFVRGEQSDKLYDMIADPSQKHDIAGQKQEIVNTFHEQFDNWFADVSRIKIKPEITQIGSAGGSRIELFAPDASLSGQLQYYGKNGYVHDWLVGWKHPDDVATWNINVVNKGKYKVMVTYNLPEDMVGTHLNLVIADQILTTTIKKPFNGAFIKSANRVPDAGVPERDWGELPMGSIMLYPGYYTLKIMRPDQDVKRSAIEIKSVILNKYGNN
ncbi:MAG: arylsulfatase [Chitinophagaceae bacterium]